MATYIETVLPSGKGLRLVKINTKIFREVQERVVNRIGEGNQNRVGTVLNHELLLRSFAGITAGPLEWETTADKTVDIDAMLSKVPNEAWLRPTYEELIIADGTTSLDVLLDDVSDYATALVLVQDITMPNRGRAGSLAGKTRTAFVEP